MKGDVGLQALAAHLEVTARRPVETEATRWLGEAEAIASDLDRADPVEPGVVIDRLETVQRLLAEVEATGDPLADAHVTFACRVTDRVLGEVRQT